MRVGDSWAHCAGLPIAACLLLLTASACAPQSGPHCKFTQAAEDPAIDLGGYKVQLRATAIVDGKRAPALLVFRDLGRCQQGTIDVRVESIARANATLSGYEIEATFPKTGHLTTWWSQGFQSWSQSGALALPEVPPTDAEVQAALAIRGDAETMRDGAAISWWGTAVGRHQDGQGVLVMANDADAWKTYVRVVSKRGENLRLRVVSGAGESVAVGTPTAPAAPTIRIYVGPDLHAALHEFGDVLPRRLAKPEIGWNSWYDLWDTVSAASFLANVGEAREILTKPAKAHDVPLRMVLDDGWQVAWGDWRVNEKFSGGLAKLVADRKAEGVEMGLWLAPLLVSAKLPLVQQHPDWFVGSAVYPHLVHGEMRVLDVTHPDARKHLQSQLTALRDAGLSLLKIDFLFAGTYEGTRHQPRTGMQAYRLALEAIREAVGPKMILLAVGAPPLGTIGLVDAWRFGPDIALQPFGAKWAWLPAELRTYSVRWPYCRAVLCDADPALLRDLPADEVGFGAAVLMLAGGGWWLSDNLPALNPTAKARGVTPEWIAAAVSGKPAEPVQVMPDNAPAKLRTALLDFAEQKSQHILPLAWKLPTGQLLGVNPGDAEQTVKGVGSVPAHAMRLGVAK